MAALVGLFVVTAPGLVSIEVVRRSIAHEIAGWGGRALAFEGAPTVAFRPYLTVTFPRATIVSARTGDVLVSMDQLSAQIPLLPLIFGGNIEPTAFDFRRPDFHFSVDAGGQLNWTLPNGLDATTRVERIRIRDGAIHFRDASGRAIDLAAVDARLNWPGSSGAASLRGSAGWRGQTGNFSIEIGSLRDFFDGQSSTLDLSLASGALKAAFTGQFQQLDGLVANGDLWAEVPSIRELAGVFGWQLADRDAFGKAALRGSMAFSRGVARLADAAVSIDGNDGEGVVALDMSAPRPAVQATLAFDDLELAPFVDLAAAEAGKAREHPTEAIDVSAFSAVDLDTRISADRVAYRALPIGRLAATAALRAGRLDLALGDMRLFDGRFSASLTADTAGLIPSARLAVRFDGLPLRSLPPGASPFGGQGTAKGDIRIDVSGIRWIDVAERFAGKGRITVDGGSLGGLDLAALKRSLADPLANDARIHSRATAFDTASIAFRFGTGPVRIDAATITGKDYSIGFTGTAPTADTSGYDLAGTIEFPDGAGGSQSAAFIARGEGGLADMQIVPSGQPADDQPPASPSISPQGPRPAGTSRL
ncbi:MAG: hypothetical protein J0H54_12220 [Rhizobiales bacterium]|nr:hypothetical protein [Hyphomicrobiales bacterium]